ncbi:MAG: T9SS type A sorting domain-containing protein [Niastella sp.]|nr:T9SS type A sorting domain-containing protein [Niastella sp.]
MKRFLQLLLLTVSIGCLDSYSQCGNYTGNINNLPVCGQYGDASGNSNWDWELTDKNDPAYCSMWYARTDNSTILTPMKSPFVDASLTAIDMISQQQDFTRAKGWELLRRDFGCGQVTAYPYFILYNKYTSLLRVFIYRPAGRPEYSGIAVEIAPNLNSTYPATTAFSDTIQTAPDKYLGSGQNSTFGRGMVSIGQFGGSSQWSLVEFNTSYDPNIQNSFYSGTSLQFTIYGVTQNNMYASIRGGSMVSSQPVFNFTYKPKQTKTASPDGQSFDFKGVGEKFTKFSQGITSVRSEINSTATGIVSFLQGTNDTLLKKVVIFFDKIKTYTSDNGAFKETFGKLSEAVKGAGSFFKIASAVIGLFSESSGASGSPTYTNYDLVLQGTITTRVVQGTFLLRVPGTNQINNDNATYYKCPLGIFNIANTPQADVVTYRRQEGLEDYTAYPILRDYVSYRMRNNLTVSFNQAAGLELVSAQAAIVGEILPNSNGTASYDLFRRNFIPESSSARPPELNHMRPDLENDRLEIKHYDINKGLHIFQTRYTNIECLNGLAFNAPATTKVYLQIKAVMKKQNDPSGTPIIYVQNYAIETFAATISEQMKNNYMFSAAHHLPPYANYTELPLYNSNLIVANWTYTGPDVDKADNTVTTQGNITIATSAPVIFAAGGAVNLNPGFHAQYGSDFTAKINDFGYTLNCGTLQVAPAVLPSNCYNTNITALSQNTTETATVADDVAASELKVFPTLSNGSVNIIGRELQQAHIVIVDQSGRVVYQYVNRSNKSMIQLNLNHLTNGIYFIKIDNPGKTVTRKILISK